MQQNNEIVDVEFTEIKKEEVKPQFNPAVFLTEALVKAGLHDAAVQWSQGIDPRAETAESEKDRIFFANRALRLFLAEQEGRDNITPRMLLADGIDAPKWIALMEQGVIPWLRGEFDKKGKRVAPESEQAPAEQQAEQAVVVGMDVATGEDQTAVVTAEVPPPHFANGQWNGVPLSDFPDIQEQVRKGLDDGSLVIQGAVGEAPAAEEGTCGSCGECGCGSDPASGE